MADRRVALSRPVPCLHHQPPPQHQLQMHSAHDLDSQFSIAWGITVGLLASFVQSLGLTIQRKSHVLNERLTEFQQRPYYRRP